MENSNFKITSLMYLLGRIQNTGDIKGLQVLSPVKQHLGNDFLLFEPVCPYATVIDGHGMCYPFEDNDTDCADTYKPKDLYDETLTYDSFDEQTDRCDTCCYGDKMLYHIQFAVHLPVYTVHSFAIYDDFIICAKDGNTQLKTTCVDDLIAYLNTNT